MMNTNIAWVCVGQTCKWTQQQNITALERGRMYGLCARKAYQAEKSKSSNQPKRWLQPRHRLRFSSQRGNERGFLWTAFVFLSSESTLLEKKAACFEVGVSLCTFAGLNAWNKRTTCNTTGFHRDLKDAYLRTPSRCKFIPTPFLGCKIQSNFPFLQKPAPGLRGAAKVEFRVGAQSPWSHLVGRTSKYKKVSDCLHSNSLRSTSSKRKEKEQKKITRKRGCCSQLGEKWTH